VALLLAATAGAMVLTQHLRHEGSVVSDIYFKRPGGGYRACFRLTRDDTAEVAMVDASGNVVRVLAQNARLEGSDSAPDSAKAGAHCFEWNGTDSSGRPVPAGVYRMRITLQRADRTATPGEHLVIPAQGAS
jgi:FlgD Ig-like domain